MGRRSLQRAAGYFRHLQPEFNTPLSLYFSWQLQELTAEHAHEILKRISDEDCRALGFNPKFARPDWMVLTAFPVPPPAVRPSVMMDGVNR